LEKKEPVLRKREKREKKETGLGTEAGDKRRGAQLLREERKSPNFLFFKPFRKRFDPKQVFYILRLK